MHGDTGWQAGQPREKLTSLTMAYVRMSTQPQNGKTEHEGVEDSTVYTARNSKRYTESVASVFDDKP